MITQSQLADIVAKATFLSEHLSEISDGIEKMQIDRTKGDARLDRWCQVVAQGNWKKFHKRLQWDGLNVDDVRPILASSPVSVEHSLPQWALTLQDIIQGIQNRTIVCNLQTKNATDSQEPLPFEDLLLPIVQVARQKLLAHLKLLILPSQNSPLELLSEEAYLAMERALLSRLINICGNTLEFEFSHFCPCSHSILSFLGEKIELLPSTTYYEAFVEQNLQDGLQSFLYKYPVLGRLVATQTNFWIEATAEFLQRLENDIFDIYEVFGKGLCFKYSHFCLGKVANISSNLSDAHDSGRYVIALTFESGLKLVYKPKNMSLQVAYNQLLDWCNQQNIGLPLKILKVLDRQTYGWIEYVEHLPCGDETSAQQFYKRAGMLLCLVYALGGTDCHCENLIANGEHPVLIDVETLLHHNATEVENNVETQVESKNLPLVPSQLLNTVVATGFLPCWELTPDKRSSYDIGGLASIDSETLLSPMLRWKYINTDRMHQRYEHVKMPVEKNTCFLGEIPVSPNNYLRELVEGFSQMYHLLMVQRQSLFAQSTFFENLKTQQIRFLFRNTKVYGAILSRTLTPALLQNGMEWSIELDVLARAFLITQDRPKDWSILHAELKQMERLDIPYFAAAANSDSLPLGLKKSLERYFKEPSYDRVVSRLQNLNQTDLNLQIAIIQGAFNAKVASLPISDRYQATKKTAFTPIGSSNHETLTQEQFLLKAQEIAKEIASRALPLDDCSSSWLGFSYLSSVNRFQSNFSDKDFYQGNCGIALFLAALDYVQNTNQFRNLVLQALCYTRRVAQFPDRELAQRHVKAMGIGGASGIGSIIYCLVRISRFLKEPELIEDALKFAALITPEIIAADQQLDVIDGAAGAILGLLALYRETNDVAVLEKAIVCGQHLLKCQTGLDGVPKAWKTIDNKMLTGLSHGVAGISYALLRLYEATNDVAYREAAKEGIAYENTLFSPSAQNWADLRPIALENGKPSFPVSWCHGAAGIALARLGGLSAFATDEMYQNVETALQAIEKSGLQGVDHVCCGNFGQCEVLLVAAQTLSRPKLLEMARQKATWTTMRAEKNGGYQLFANLSAQVLNPGFFQGTAGIGYSLLRLAFPDALPSVLLWQ